MSRGARDNLASRTRAAQTGPPYVPEHGVKHVWVVDQDGRNPGLLHRWRRVAAGWQGYVSHPVLDADGWAIVEEWLPAERLEKA